MKRTINIFLVLAVAVPALMLTGCRKYDTPDVEERIELDPTHSIAEFKELIGGGEKLEFKTEDYVIKGRVTSSDYRGNFYRIIYIEDATSGIELKLGPTFLYNRYRPGTVVSVKAKGLCLGYYRGMVSLGYPTVEGDEFNNTWIDNAVIIKENIILGEYKGEVTPFEITTLGELTDEDNLGRLVKIRATYTGRLGFSFYYDNEGNRITLTELDTWAHPNNPEDPDDNAGYGSHIFEFRYGDGENDVIDILIRTSGFAKFAGEKVTDRVQIGQEADIVAIFTRFGSNPAQFGWDYQLVLNDSIDVKAVVN